MSNHTTARWGEAIAATYLRSSGWTVRARNYRAGRREIDLIAQRGRQVAFIEVKTRRGEGFGSPLAAVSGMQRRSIARVAADWIARYGKREMEYRYDAIAIERRGGRTQLQHLPDAWGI